MFFKDINDHQKVLKSKKQRNCDLHTVPGAGPKKLRLRLQQKVAAPPVRLQLRNTDINVPIFLFFASSTNYFRIFVTLIGLIAA
jgi:hypothetical protein